MAIVRLEFSPEPAHVRTARLVGVAVARKAGLPEDRLDEVRLAIGEACGRAVTRHQRHRLRSPIVVEMSDDNPYTVRVTDRAPGGLESRSTDPVDEITEEASLLLLTGVADEFSVAAAEEGGGSVVSMIWPLKRSRR
jgi:anti-sigma regulatory factor (Ser/Thr protein kinase)